MAVRYVTLQFLLRGTVRWYGTPFLEWYGYGTLVRYASKIELKYGTLVRYGSRCEVRSTQIANVPYRTAILAKSSLLLGQCLKGIAYFDFKGIAIMFLKELHISMLW